MAVLRFGHRWPLPRKRCSRPQQVTLTFGLPLLLGAAGTLGCVHRGSNVDGPPAVVLNEFALQPGTWRKSEVASLTSSATIDRAGVSFDDPRSVLRLVLSAAPARAVVYPTERYYYYRFVLGPRVVSGNIRLADAEEGAFSVGYFDAYAQQDMRVGQFKDGQDGVSISYHREEGEILVRVDGLSRVFVLDRSALQPPQFELLPGEEHVSGVRDESGYYLHLIYYRPGRAFYYVLNEQKPRPEAWTRGDSGEVEAWFGDRSRFCFVRHAATDRFILVGVNRREIAQNTWYDGPFDQVPPRLPLRERLEEAYPYVQDAGGLDEHGNFLELEGQRVAISPYRAYESGAALERDLERMIHDADDPTAWTTATYESKRDWRAPTGPGPVVHQKALSLGWPANHWGASSRGWGAEHDVELSRSWPANHDVQVSRATEHSD